LPDRIVEKSWSPARLVATAGATIGLCIVGDSLLYSILPLAAPGLGLSLAQVGVLLSANRLVRLASNAPMGALFEKYGPRHLFVVVCVLGLISTMVYGAGWGFATFLAARLLWGIAWSGLRQGGYQAVWTGALAIKGRLTGLLWGVVRLGSAGSVLLGGWLYDWYGYGTTIAVMVGVTVLALPVALSIRWPAALHAPPPVTSGPAVSGIVSKLRTWLSVLNTPERRWLTVITALQLLAGSVIISTTSLFLARLVPNLDTPVLLGFGIAGTTGLLQGVRWLSDMLIAPTIGYLSDQIGQANMMALLICISFSAVLGLVQLPLTLAVLCLLLVFVCDSGMTTVLSASASGAALHADRPNLFIGLFATAGDIGSALGPLFAFPISRVIGLPVLYTVLSGSLLLTILSYRWLNNGRR